MNDTVETKQCTNCKLEILSNNYMIHSLHCHRNFYICSKCQQPVNHIQKIEHDSTNHVVVHCTNCNIKLEKCCLRDHLINNCPHRAVKCQICGIEIKATDITEHENYCGSRTEKCLDCNKFVMLKYKTLHIDSNHTFVKLPDEPRPSPSWQNGRRTLFNFMPDMTSRNFEKGLSSQRKKSSENHKKRLRISSAGSTSENEVIHAGFKENNSVSSNDSFTSLSTYLETRYIKKSNQLKGNLHEFNQKNCYQTFSSKKENVDEEFRLETDDAFNIQKTKKQLKRDIHNWSDLSGFSSLQISDQEQNDSKSGAQYEAGERSDLVYALKISQELNSPLWNNKFASGKDEALTNFFTPDVEISRPEAKDMRENICASRTKDEIEARPENNPYENGCDDDLLYTYEQNADYKIKEITLPCEFCGALIISDSLILHQSGCDKHVNESTDKSNTKLNSRILAENEDVEIPCDICNEPFRLSLLENHELHCNRNLWKNKDKTTFVRNIKPVKTLSGLQNGVKQSSPRFSGVETRSEWLTNLSKSSKEGGKDFINNFNQQKKPKFSQDKRTPSPTKM